MKDRYLQYHHTQVGVCMNAMQVNVLLNFFTNFNQYLNINQCLNNNLETPGCRTKSFIKIKMIENQIQTFFREYLIHE